MEVTKWLDRSADGGGNGGGDFDDDNNNSSSSGDNFGEGMYVKVIGHLRDFKGKKAIGAYHMSQIEHPDLITMHALDAALVHLELTRGILNNNNNKNPHTNVVGAGGAGAAVGGGGAPRMQFHDDNPNFSKLENAVSGFVRRMATGSEGVVINDVVFGLRR